MTIVIQDWRQIGQGHNNNKTLMPWLSLGHLFCAWQTPNHLVGQHLLVIVEKLQFSFSMISSLLRSSTLLDLPVAFLKIACLHESFTAYENFYRLSKNALSSESCFPLSLHQKYQKSETQQSNIYPLIHWLTYP